MQKVLLIEADAVSRQQYAEALRAANFSVSTAKDGPTGMLIFKSTQPDLVVSNMVLGEMTAVDICEKIRSNPDGEKIRIILLSNSARSSKYVEGISSKYRVSHFLQKPLSTDDLLKVVKTSLGSNGSHGKEGAAPAAAAGALKETAKRQLPKYFPGLLLFYADRKVTGTLTLRKETQEKVVYLDNGEPVGIDSNLKGEQLGKVLVEKGVINEADYMRSAQVMVEEGIQLGEALIKLGCLDKSVLDELINEHQIYKIAACFLWFDAEVKFQEAKPLPKIKNYGAVALDKVFKTGLTLLRKTPNLGKILTPILNEYVGTNDLYDHHLKFLGFGEAEMSSAKLLGKGYQLEEILVPENESVLVTLYLAGMLETTAPRLDVLKERIQELKNNAISGNQELAKQLIIDREHVAKLQQEAEGRAKKHQEEVTRLMTQLQESQETVAKTKSSASETQKQTQEFQKNMAALKSEMQKYQAELELSREEIRTAKTALEQNTDALKKSQAEKASLEESYRRLQAQLLDAEKARAVAERKITSDMFDAPSAAAPSSAPLIPAPPEPTVDTAAGAAAAAIAAFDLAPDSADTGMFEGLDVDGVSLPTAPPPGPTEVPSFDFSSQELSDEPLAPPSGDAVDLFELAGSEIGSLSDLEGGTATPNPDATIMMGIPAQPIASPQPLIAEPFEEPAALEPLAEPLEASALETDSIFDLLGSEVGALSNLEGGGLSANPDSTIVMNALNPSSPPPAPEELSLGGLDGELDQAFEQIEDGGLEPQQSILPIDPFAPQAVRHDENPPAPPAAPATGNDLEDFFGGVPDKA